MARILIVEPEPGRQASLRSRVQDEGHEVLPLESVRLAVAQARDLQPDLLLVAEELDGSVDGYELSRSLARLEEATAPVLLCSALPATPERIERALQAGCEAFLGKTEVAALGPILARVLAHRSELAEYDARQQALELENRRLRDIAHVDWSAPREAQVPEATGEQPEHVAVLVVDGSGVVQKADHGARELLGAPLEGRGLGALVPSSGLEAFVRDTRTERRRGFRFDLAGPRGTRALVASVTPLAPVGGTDRDAGTGADGGFPDVLRVVTIRVAPRTSEAGGLRAKVAMHHELAALLENARETYRVESWLGTSALARGLRMAARSLVEQREAPVLIQGPRGTGKELLARILHYSGRASGALLRMRCSAFAPEHVGRELFGDLEGSDLRSSGDSRTGLYQLAKGGTLLLEEVGELPLPVQEQLLAALTRSESGSGEGPTRWIVTSVEELRDLVRAGRFREDLYVRLRTHELVTTPISTRREDLMELVRHYLQRFGAAKGVVGLSPAASEALYRYEWPGNVDELEDCLEQACARCSGGELRFDDLSRAVRAAGGGLGAVPSLVGSPSVRTAQRAPLATAVEADPRPWEITDSDPISLDLYQKKALLRALARCDGDKVAAAKLLNVGKSTFYRKLKRYGITEVPGSTQG